MSTVPQGYGSDFDIPTDQRVSGLAISSLVTGILCCIPGMGLLAMILGISSMLAISRAEGRLTGRGMAVAGLVLGLAGCVFTMAVGFATWQGQAVLHNYGMTYQLIEQKDYAALRTRMEPQVAATLTDQQIDAFRDKVAAEWGAFSGTPKGLADWFRSYMDVGPAMNQTVGQPNNNLRKNIYPVPGKFTQGTTLMIYPVDPSRGTGSLPGAILNVLVTDKAGKPIWLIEPAPSTPPPSPAAPKAPAPDQKPSTPEAPAPGPKTGEGSPPPTGG
jgi:hypothetical protein